MVGNTKICFILVLAGYGEPTPMQDRSGEDTEPTVNPRTRNHGPGSGTSSDWSYCSNSSPCTAGHGDCDSDAQCAGSLTCGQDNCKDFNSAAHRLADCCIGGSGGVGSSSDWSYCSTSNVCSLGQGDCDSDSQCSGSLVCGNNNCRDFHPNAQSNADCCIAATAAGTGSNSDWSYCSTSNMCSLQQGDCDSDSQCSGSLVCGDNNCRDFHPTAQPLADCCVASGCKCGVTKSRRIVGGTVTEVNEYPWIALLSIGRYRCSGSLIASEWVVTAAHCVYDQSNNLVSTSTITVVLGEHDTATLTESIIPRKVLSVTKIIPHQDYSPTGYSYDIALLKLSEAVDLDVYTPVCLPNTGDNFIGKIALVYGWGRTSASGPVSTKLMEVDVKIVSDTDCQNAFDNSQDPQVQAANYQITSDMICAGGIGGKDSCGGDSGGPLSLPVNNKHMLAGVVSWGHSCAVANLFGVYTETAVYRTWVDGQIAANGGATYCPS
eukprot:GFUD01005388.1.p1 GENE.GFUD01005388.1~~GFUD01005388.1.p1  ORF type:complete len:490 (-),score=75.79 GFUD01005388.1:64-1533(-)